MKKCNYVGELYIELLYAIVYTWFPSFFFSIPLFLHLTTFLLPSHYICIQFEFVQVGRLFLLQNRDE